MIMSTASVSNLSSSSSSLHSSSSNGSAQSLEDEKSEEGGAEQHVKADNGKSTSTDDSASKERPAWVSEYRDVSQDCIFVAQWEGTSPFPPLEDVDNYKWAPQQGDVIQTMMNLTLACHKACRKAWNNK